MMYDFEFEEKDRNDLDYIEILKNTSLFKNFEKEHINEFISSVNHKVACLKKEDILFFEGDKFPYLCILISGEIMLSSSDESGNRNIIDIVKPGQMFAEVFSFTADKISPVTAQANSDCRIFLINTDTLLSSDGNTSHTVLHKYNIVSSLLSTFAEKNMILLSKIEIISRRNTREKILHYLEMQKTKTGSSIFNIPYSRKEMADFLGVDRSALSRELSRLKEEGIIDFDKNTFKIL